MEQSPNRPDSWSIPLLLLWQVFFWVGLFPEPVFYLLRDTGRVVTQNAWVNSPAIISIALAIYLAVFVFNRCRDSGLEGRQARGKALQSGVVAAVAFMPFRIDLLLNAGEIPVFNLRLIVYLVAAVKFASWLYLLSLITRYYGVGNSRVFVHMACVFPSTWSGSATPAERADGGEAAEQPKAASGE